MDHDMNMGSSSHSSSMSMVFTTDHSTPLFSNVWTPKNRGAYAGTCIFLVVLAIISRMLAAWRTKLELDWHDRAVKRRYIVVATDTERLAVEEKGEDATLTSRGVDERVKVVKSNSRDLEIPPWRFSTDLPRAALFTLMACVSYLLMLAVMTLNVGYFLSTLAGLFVGELVVGRFASADDGHSSH
ncbi:hypothetical protein K470DRAFT_258661 [Piedraia hortae CBS 480.64]|uniref:Copper transport protein n=1 Tax=Piedraia hortae CBS 480.64 TaxID=1314780 RepID=A0A6A7BWR1_9PEZI|nr:hypothetical protein K470DRAFT_258661 [Piedraia hortae CBS 480.64]